MVIAFEFSTMSLQFSLNFPILKSDLHRVYLGLHFAMILSLVGVMGSGQSSAFPRKLQTLQAIKIVQGQRLAVLPFTSLVIAQLRVH